MSYLSRSSTLSSNEGFQLGLPPFMQALTAPQRNSLGELKDLCVKNHVYWTTKSGDGRRVVKRNEDATLIRYLRAREWKVGAAYKQYSATVAWRRKIQLDEMYRTANISHFEAINRVMPQWTGRRSRRGVPLFVYSVASVRPEDIVSTSCADPTLSSVFLPAEYSSQFIQPVCGRLHVDGVMPCLMHIIDLNGVGIKHFWSLRAHLQKAAGMATSHYPESVDKIFIVGAPSFFPTIWGYITKWFDPAIVSKVSVLPSSKALDILTTHIHLDDLPKSFGGGLDWEYGMPPNFDDETRVFLGSLADEWVEGPLVYSQNEGCGTETPSETIIAAGTDASKKPRATVLARFPYLQGSIDDRIIIESP